MAAWVQVDAFLATIDHRLEQDHVPDYQLADVPPPQGRGRPGGRSRGRPGRGYRSMAGRPRTALVLTADQAREAAEVAAQAGVMEAAAQAGVDYRTLQAAWQRYGIAR